MLDESNQLRGRTVDNRRIASELLKVADELTAKSYGAELLEVLDRVKYMVIQTSPPKYAEAAKLISSIDDDVPFRPPYDTLPPPQALTKITKELLKLDKMQDNVNRIHNDLGEELSEYSYKMFQIVKKYQL